MVTITLPRETIEDYLMAPKGLEISLKSEEWTVEQGQAVCAVVDLFGLTDFERVEISESLETMMMLRVFKAAIQNRER